MTKERARQLLKRLHPDSNGGHYGRGQKQALLNVIATMKRAANRFAKCLDCGQAIARHAKRCHPCAWKHRRAVAAGALLLAGCAAPTGPKLPPPPTVSPKYMLDAIEYPVAPLLPPYSGCAWSPSPDSISLPSLVYEVWAGDTPITLTHVTNTTECIYLEPTSTMRFFAVRAYDPVSGLHSDWATSIYKHAEQP